MQMLHAELCMQGAHKCFFLTCVVAAYIQTLSLNAALPLLATATILWHVLTVLALTAVIPLASSAVATS